MTVPVEIKDAGKPPVAEAGESGSTGTTAPTVTAPSDSPQAGESKPATESEKTETDPATAADDAQQPAEEEEAVEPAEQDELVNIAPGSFTSVATFGPPDSYFQQVEKQYPGPVGGLVTPSEEWTGYNRQFGRKVTVALNEAKPLERVALTFKQQKRPGSRCRNTWKSKCPATVKRGRTPDALSTTFLLARIRWSCARSPSRCLMYKRVTSGYRSR